MLGRHVYRVHSEDGRWTVLKEGEDRPRGTFVNRSEAVSEAARLAGSDQPSKVVIDNGDGTLGEEQLFGADPGENIGA
ncbi:MAG: DUF2188 domain-containing protein [Alphaproteobacteria bacterium]|nr:DUF2188 domain-containing protein [Alphaproteobacteria bacterium]